MDRLIVRPSVPDDIIPIAENISDFDKDDLGDTSPQLNLAYGLHYSDTCMTIETPEGKPLGIFGVISIGDIASVWMLTTKELVTTYRIQFIREGRKWTDWLLTKYPILINLMPIDHEHKWLTWVGFKDHGVIGVGELFKYRKMIKQ